MIAKSTSYCDRHSEIQSGKKGGSTLCAMIEMTDIYIFYILL